MRLPLSPTAPARRHKTPLAALACAAAIAPTIAPTKASAQPAPSDPPRLGRYIGVASDLYEPHWAMFTDDRRAIVRLADGSFIAITIDDPEAPAWTTSVDPLDPEESREAHQAWQSTHTSPADHDAIPIASLEPGPFHQIATIRDEHHRLTLLDTYADTLHRAPSPDAEPSAQWQSIGGFGAFPGLMAHPHGLTSHANRLYIADTRNHRIQVFNDRLEYEHEWGLHVVRPHEGEGHLHYPTSIAIAPDGAIAMVCEPAQDRIQFFAPLADGQQAEVTQPLFQRETLAHFGPHAASDGPLLVTTEPDRPGLIVWDLTRPLPIMIGRIAGHGDDFGHFRAIGDVSLDIEGPNGSPRVWVFDPAHRRIQTFDLDWSPDKPLGFDPFLARFVRAIDLDALPIADQPGRITQALRCADGSWAIATTDPPTVRIADADLREATQHWALHADDRIALVESGRTLAILAARAGQLRLIPIDGSDRPVRAFMLINNSGPTRSNWQWLTEPLEEPGHPGTARLLFEFAHPFDYHAILLEDDRLWITDRRSHRVLAFDLAAAARDAPPSTVPYADGIAEKSIIGPLVILGLVDGDIPPDPRDRLGPALFHKPSGLATDNLGNIIVIDEGNHRIQFFDRDGKFLDALGARLFTTPATRDAPGRFDP
ncbi:MAG: hypothetical protein ACTS3F_08375 [Phycisphaerales bacterium]